MSNAPSVPTGTYPVAEEVLQLSRAMVNDMLRDTAGRILTDSAPFTLIYLNSAIRKTQRHYANNGLYSYIKDNVIIPAIPPAASNDPSVQVFLSAQGYFDGVAMHSTPTLPLDLILPLAIFERQTGSGSSFSPMSPSRGDGLVSRVPGQTFDDWEWRNDNINLIGSTNTNDLKVRYESMIPPVVLAANLSPQQATAALSQTSIPLRDSHEALAAWTVWFYAFARGSEMRVECEKMANEQMDIVVDRYVRKDQRIAYRSRGYRAGGGPIDGALTGSYK